VKIAKTEKKTVTDLSTDRGTQHPTTSIQNEDAKKHIYQEKQKNYQLTQKQTEI
jgi:hypothetical protein